MSHSNTPHRNLQYYFKKILWPFRKWWFYPILLIVGFLAFAYTVLELRASDDYFPRLAKAPYPYQFERYEVEDRTIRYLELGQDSLPLIVLIHGAPSSALSWRSLFADSLLLSKAKIVAVDRPGYGYSGFGKVVTSIAKQAEMIAPILKKCRTKHQAILVVGSSYGGPVAAKLGMDYPELMDGLMFNSASVAPGEEKTYFISYPTTHWALEWLVPTTLRVANHEKLAHRNELLRIVPDWDKITHPCTVFHGVVDDLVYIENAYFMERKLVNATELNMVVLPDKEHGMVFSDPQLVIKVMLDALERTIQYVKKSDKISSITY